MAGGLLGDLRSRPGLQGISSAGSIAAGLPAALRSARAALESWLGRVVLLTSIEHHADLIGGAVAEDEPQRPVICCDMREDSVGDVIGGGASARCSRLAGPGNGRRSAR